jgi:hypothetical protein
LIFTAVSFASRRYGSIELTARRLDRPGDTGWQPKDGGDDEGKHPQALADSREDERETHFKGAEACTFSAAV